MRHYRPQMKRDTGQYMIERKVIIHRGRDVTPTTRHSKNDSDVKGQDLKTPRKLFTDIFMALT